jgi:hypothetical protein
MAIPSEFSYASEDQFIQDFLIPLLQRLGFSLVVNYHGQSELGKDLIFAELDRFGHVRYHGLQAKYEPSISLNEIEGLICDCKQAFSNPFTHPQTGIAERISSFYAINGGSVGHEATQHYFNSLLPSYGGNARLLQGRDLLTLDKWASVNRMEDVLSIINGLLIEIKFNDILATKWIACLRESLNRANAPFLIDRFRTNASSSYLIKPILQTLVTTDEVLQYSDLVIICNKLFDYIGQGILNPDNRKQLKLNCIEKLEKLNSKSVSLLSAIMQSLKKIGPLTAL